MFQLSVVFLSLYVTAISSSSTTPYYLHYMCHVRVMYSSSKQKLDFNYCLLSVVFEHRTHENYIFTNRTA